MYKIMYKICRKCSKKLNISKFSDCKRNKDSLQDWCRDCFSDYRAISKERLKKRRQELAAERRAFWAVNEPDYTGIKKCCTCKKPKEKKFFSRDNITHDGLRKSCKKCARIRTNKWEKKRRKNDPLFRLRKRVSTAIWAALRNRNLSKENHSVWNFLPYTAEILKQHIESFWEPWMCWDNHGSYSSNKRTWQIDHVVPQSAFTYDSMEHPDFLKCWALENLKPLESICNLRKSNKINV